MKLKRTEYTDVDFIKLVKALDADLAIRDGEDHAFYHQFNSIDSIKNAIVLYDGDQAIACGAFKKYSSDTAEIKRMYVLPAERGKGAGRKILQALELWAKEIGFEKCILETGLKQPEAIALYTKSGFRKIPNYGQYVGIENSVCFEKRFFDKSRDLMPKEKQK